MCTCENITDRVPFPNWEHGPIGTGRLPRCLSSTRDTHQTGTGVRGHFRDLLTCHGVLFGTPENFGYMSGAIKDFFDRTFYPAQPYRLNLPYALFISAGNDGTGAVRQIDRILLGYPMRQVAEPVICRGTVTAEHLTQCEELGMLLATGLACGIF